MKTLKAENVLGIKVRKDEDSDDFQVIRGGCLDAEAERKYTLLEFGSYDKLVNFIKYLDGYRKEIHEKMQKQN